MNTPDDSPLNSPHASEDEKLSRILCSADKDYLMDGSFTARVSAALPSRRTVAWRRPLLIGFGALLGSVLTRIAGGPELLGQISALYLWASDWSLPLWASVSLQFSVVLSIVLSGVLAWMAWSESTR